MANSPVREGSHFLGGFDPNLGIIQEGIQIPAIQRGDHNNVSPRLGYGTAVKNPFRGPGYWNLDTSLAKTQKFTERVSAEFRAEIFNIFNHPNFAQPGTSLNSCTLSSCTFGKTTATPDVAAVNPVLGSGGQRRVQFGVKIIF